MGYVVLFRIYIHIVVHNGACLCLRTVGAVKSRWFREVRSWRDRQQQEQIDAKVAEGRKLAVERYGVTIRYGKTSTMEIHIRETVKM